MKSYRCITVCLFSIVFLATGCLFYPTMSKEEPPPCDLVTRRLILDVYVMTSVEADEVTRELERVASSNCDEPECLLVYAPIVAVSAGSAIVSGSIVVIGNGLHWLEQQGSCEDGVLRNAVLSIRTSAIDAGGWMVESGRDLINWFDRMLAD